MSHKNVLNMKMKLTIKSISKVSDYLDIISYISNCHGKRYEKPINDQRNINIKFNHLLTNIKRYHDLFLREFSATFHIKKYLI